MKNEGHTNSNHSSIMNTMDDEKKKKEQPSPSLSKSKSVFPTNHDSAKPKKPSWQIVRDASMNILARQASKLGFKQGNYNIFSFCDGKKCMSDIHLF